MDGDDMKCGGCAARQSEIEYLRKQLAEMQDRLLAALSPGALTALRGGVGSGAAREAFVDEAGHAYVTVQGEAVPVKAVQVGGVDVSPQEYQMAMGKLMDALSGKA